MNPRQQRLGRQFRILVQLPDGFGGRQLGFHAVPQSVGDDDHQVLAILRAAPGIAADLLARLGRR